MENKRITLTESDYNKLKKLMEVLKASRRLNSPHLYHLQSELYNAVIMEKDMIPGNRVTLYSDVLYTDLRDNTVHRAAVVLPAENDDAKNRYSILAPLGTALIGEEEGSVTTCYAPCGEIPLKVEKVIHQVGEQAPV